MENAFYIYFNLNLFRHEQSGAMYFNIEVDFSGGYSLSVLNCKNFTYKEFWVEPCSLADVTSWKINSKQTLLI